MQGVRSDGIPIPMTIVADNATHIEVSFKDIVRAKPRDGIVSFPKPCHYHFRLKPAQKNLGDKGTVAEHVVRMYMLALPIDTGLSRLFIVRFPVYPETKS